MTRILTLAILKRTRTMLLMARTLFYRTLAYFYKLCFIADARVDCPCRIAPLRIAETDVRTVYFIVCSILILVLEL